MFRALNEYFFPVVIALALHAGILAMMMANWGNTDTVNFRPNQDYDYIAAKFVVLPKDALAPQAKPEPKKVVPQQAEKPPDEFEAARAEPIKLRRDDTPKYNREVDDSKSKPKPKPKPREVEDEARPDPAALARLRARAQAIRERQQQREQTTTQREEIDYGAAQRDAEATQSYIALITRVIQNNWNRPLSARNGMEAELLIQLVPSGDIVGVTVVRGSGNSAFDRSAENAVKKAARFPELINMPPHLFEQYFRRLRFIFRPEDLRL